MSQNTKEKKHVNWSVFWGFFRIKRLLLLALIIVIVSVVGIYIFDKYPSASTSYMGSPNAYPDEYWSELDGFLTYEQLRQNEEKYNINSPAYETPYDINDTVIQRINKARYVEELALLTQPISEQILDLNSKITALNRVYSGSKEEWIFEVLATNFLNPTVKSGYDSCQNAGYTGTKDEWTSLLVNEPKSAFVKMRASGYSGTYQSWIEYLIMDNNQGATSAYAAACNSETNPYEGTFNEWLLHVSGVDTFTPQSAYNYALSRGYQGSVDTWLVSLAKREGEFFYEIQNDGYEPTNDYEIIMAIYNDLGNNKVLPAYEAAKTVNTEMIEELVNERGQLESFINDANARNLPRWSEYFSRYQYMFENDGYELWFNYAITSFKVVEKATGNEWYSNPTTVDSTSLRSPQSTILTIYYGSTAGALNGLSTYDYSVSTTNTSGKSVDPNFAVKVDPETKTIQVWYHLERRGIDYTYFPQYFSRDRYNQLIANNKQNHDNNVTDSNNDLIPYLEDRNDPIAQSAYGRWFESWYQLVPSASASNERGYDYYEYKGGTFQYMSEIVVTNLYLWMYDWCGYTQADLISDNEEFGVEFNAVNPAFEIAIEYKLTDTGLEVNVPGNSIREFSGYTLCNIDILPYFTATKRGVEGYTVIPDGSGAVLMNDNGNTKYSAYAKRIYTTDLSQTSVVKKASSYDIMLPMYAVVDTTNNAGVIVEALKMASQLELRADVSGRGSLGESNNTHYYRAYIRESQDVWIGTYAKEPVRKFTDDLLTDDIVLSYTFLAPLLEGEEKVDYSFVAQKYREILIKRYDLQDHDKTTSPVLDIDVIGSYTFKNNFLGIGYTDDDSMTTYEELEKIIDTYLDMGIEYINAFYLGWRKESLVNTSFQKIKLNSILGSKAQLQQLVNKDENVTIYPYVSVGELHEYQENFGSNRYTSRDVIGEIITKYPYASNTNAWDETARKISVLSPHYYYAFVQSLVDNYTNLFGTNSDSAKAIGLNSISMDKFGSNLSGDYKKGNEMFKTGAINEQIRALEYAYNNGLDKINLYAPYDYAFKYVTNAKEIPYQATQYEILDYSIPFYQLVVNGLFDYSGESINANIEKGLDYHIMKLIETGSNPAFTFTYDNSRELLQTDYNMYYYTEYTQWTREVQEIYKQLNDLNIYACDLVKHEYLEPSVYAVTYQDRTTGTSIKIILNYSLTSVNYNGTTIPAKSYHLG